MATEYHIAYLSPSGSTKRVAQALARGVSGGDRSISLTDLADTRSSTALLDSMWSQEATGLFLGSPVYFNRAIPPVLEFIKKLPTSSRRWAVPFVTYGKACSGVALWQMAMALRDKGYRIAGAAKVLAVHSLMWKVPDPEGEGHPNASELERIRAFAETLQRRIQSGATHALDPAALSYHPESLTEEIKATIGQPWPILPKTLDNLACSECGTCADECPVSAITMDPLPDFGESCIDCFKCVRLCPEGAIVPVTPLKEIEVMVRNRVRAVNEKPPTQVFLPPERQGTVPVTMDGPSPHR